MHARGVQGGKPRSSRFSNTPAMERSVMASTSFAGSRALQISRSKARRCFGRGRNSSTPWTEVSAFRARMRSISASFATSSGSAITSAATPVSAERAMAPRS